LWLTSKRTTNRATVVSQSPYSERKAAEKNRTAGPSGGCPDAVGETEAAGRDETDNLEASSPRVPISRLRATAVTLAEDAPLVW
jgi:hypothetical protein